MAKPRNQSAAKSRVLELLQGGEPLPKNLERIAAAKLDLEEQFTQRARLQRQAAKIRSRIARPSVPADTARELRAITDKVAARKLSLPVRPLDIPGIQYGQYTLLVSAPYANYLDLVGDVVGKPDLVHDVDPATGTMTCKVATATEGKSSGYVATYIAMYFRPLFDQATVRIHATMDIDFAWWVNSLGPAASTDAQGLIRVYQDGLTQVARAAYLGWGMYKEGGLDFNFGSMPGPAWSLSLPVSHKHLYQVVFSLQVDASGAGWPGSLAGSQITVRIPSVSFDVGWIPVSQ